MYKVKVEYDCTPIRHIAVQCPKCKNWFKGYDVLYQGGLSYSSDLISAEFKCPICNEFFGGITDKSTVEESSYPNIYSECLTKKEIWE